MNIIYSNINSTYSKKIQHEIEGRSITIDLFKSLFPNVAFDEYELYSRYDLTVTGVTENGTIGKYVIECKVRNIPNFKYNTCYLEYDKYTAITQSDKADHRPLYVAYYEDTKNIYVWSLNKINMDEIKKEFRKMKKTTEDDNCNNDQLVYKQVYYLPLSMAKKYNMKDGIHF